MPVGTVSSTNSIVVFRLSMNTCEVSTSLYWSRPT